MALSGYLGQDDFGGHTFVQDDGAELYVPDIPEARRLAMQFQNAPAPQTEARGGRSTLDLQFGGQSAPPAAPPTASDVAPVVQQGPRGPVVAQPYTPGKPAPAPAPPPRAPDLPGVSAPGAEPEPGAQPGLSPAEEASIHRPNAGGGGISQAQILKKAGQGVAVPGGMSTEVSGAIPENPEIEAAWAGAKKAEFDAQRTIHEANLETAEAQRLGAQQQRAQLEYQAGIDAVRMRAIEDAAANKMRMVQDFDQEAQSRYADFGPDRVFKSKGTWAVIGAAIMQGLGAWAAITGRTQNFAMDIINAQKDADVQAQRDEYMRDKDARNNLVADIARATGDLDVATEAAKAIQMNIMSAHAGEMAALSKRTDIANNWQLWQAQFRQGVVDHMQKAYERGLGNTVLKTSAAFEYPKAATGGGPLTIEQLAKREEAATRVVDARRKRAPSTGDDSGLGYEGRKEVAKARAETQAKEQSKLDVALQESAGGLSTTLQNVGRMRKLSGFSSRVGAFGFGTDEYQEGGGLVADTQTSYAKIKTGGVVTGADLETSEKVVPDITAAKPDEAALNAFEKRAKQEFVNKARSLKPSLRKVPPSQILMQYGVSATADDDKELK